MLRKPFIYVVAASFFLLPVLSFLPQPNDELIQLIELLNAYRKFRPQEKLYVHLDKPMYAAGEDIWLKTYLLDASYHTPDSLSQVVYVELLDPGKKIIQRHVLHSPNGMAHADFHLGDTIPEGNYAIRAYTNYMKNLGEEFFFLKEIKVLTQSSKATPEDNPSPARSTVDLQFFPEGGNLLAGTENRIAFKGINSLGKSIPVEGKIIDSQNKVITTFATAHSGMGIFSLTAAAGNNYRAIVTSPSDDKQEFALPPANEKGYLLKVEDARDNIKVTVLTNQQTVTSGYTSVYLLALTRGVACFAAKGEIKQNSLVTLIPKSRFPSGIAQITLFDQDLTPQCERLFFINHQHSLQVSIQPDKPSYEKREKVTLNVSVAASDKNPVTGNFSISVYDGAKVSDTEHPVSIENYLLLTSDLKGFIEDPGYYLKDTLKETRVHLDLLMMTHGWRRFSWQTLLKDPIKAADYFPEKGLVVRGTVMKSLAKKPAMGASIKVLSKNGDILILTSDSLGRFYSDKMVYYDSTELIIQTDNVKGKQTSLQFQLHPFNSSPPALYQPSSFQPTEAGDFLEQAALRNKVLASYRIAKDATLLKEVEVKATRIKEEPSHKKIYGMPDATLKGEDIPDGAINILQAMQGRLAGVHITGVAPNISVSIRGGGAPLFLLDGMQVDVDMILAIPVSDVESIDVLKGASAAIYGGNGGNGVIAVNLKSGASAYTRPTIGIHLIKYPGFYTAREFYVPRYDVPADEHNLPDIRTTLYWNPLVIPDNEGKAQISFYASDVASEYKVVMEGISANGQPGVGTGVLTVVNR